MHTLVKISLLTLAIAFRSAFSADFEAPNPNPKDIRVVPVEATPDPNSVETRVLFPKFGEIRKGSPVKGQIRLDGIALGVPTENSPRRLEVRNSSKGQTLHIFIDNQPYFSVGEAFIDALDDVENYFDQRADFEIPFKLQTGLHVIRAFPCRSYNESVKAEKAFTASVFYYQEKKENQKVDLSAPYLTYNEPQGEYSSKGNQPILLDFYITNCALSKDGYKVRLTIDNSVHRTLTSWQPYYVYGLGKGIHSFRLELLDFRNKPVPGPFNNTERTIVIK